MPPSSPPKRDRVAELLALALVFSMTAISVGAAYEIASPRGHLSTAASSVLATVLGAIVGALSGYLGHQLSPTSRPGTDSGS